jgi:tRNA(Arg) A34 adenosine deaminase TadA
MARAIELAIENVRSGRGGPFAAMIVKDGRVVSTGTNQVTSRNDPTAHAEIVAIRAACAALGSFQLDGCDIYTTCEPCPMCFGAIYWARPARVFFGATARDAADAGFDDAFIYQQLGAGLAENRIPFAERKIPFVEVSREEALACFREWKADPDRVNY